MERRRSPPSDDEHDFDRNRRREKFNRERGDEGGERNPEFDDRRRFQPGFRDDFRHDFRGDFRGEPRNDFRGDFRNDFRGEPRNDFRGEPRNDFRGEPRNDFRGEPRNDFRNDSRDFRERRDSGGYQENRADYRQDNYSRDNRDWGGNRERWDKRQPSPERDDFGRDRRHREPSPKRRRWDGGGGDFGHQGRPSMRPFRPFRMENPFQVHGTMGMPVAPLLSVRAPTPDINGDVLLSFKQFLDTQDSHIEESEASRRYNLYKNEFTAKQLQKFYAAHKTEEWFLEKYHPILRKERGKIKETYSKNALAAFIADYQSGKFEGLNLTDNSSSLGDKKEDLIQVESVQDSHDDDMLEEGGESAGNTGEQMRVLFIKSVPPNIKRAQIEEFCKKVPGFQRLELSEPNPLKKFHRVGWVTFDEGTDMNNAYKELNNGKIDSFEIHLGIYHNATRKNLKIPAITSTEQRMRKDLDLIRRLADVLNREKNIMPPFPDQKHVDSLSSQEVQKELDLMIVYLRRVHFFDYYTGMEFETEDALKRKCGQMPVRAPQGESNSDTGTWEKNLDHKIETRIHVTLDEETAKKYGKRDSEAEVEKYVQDHVSKVEESKYKCELCPKMFKGPDFVAKHIRTKHVEEVQEIEDEITFYNNYIADPHHMLPPAPPQPPLTGPPLIGGLPPAILGRPGVPASPASPGFSGKGGRFNFYPGAQGNLPIRPFSPNADFNPFRPRPFNNRGPFNPRANDLPDPRPLRNYSDLDEAPEDTSFLDYRSEGIA